MSSIVNGNIGNSYTYENADKIIRDPISILPDELVLEIFSHLNLATLGTICRVSKQWKWLTNTPILWKSAIHKELAFGNDKWAQCFGKDVVKDEDNREEFSSLPSDEFIADCKKFKSIFPEKTAKDNLMLVRLPKTLNGGITLKNFGELVNKYFSGSNIRNRGYTFDGSHIAQKLGDNSIDRSHWVLMTKDVLPESIGKSYVEQQELVAKLADKSLIGYEVPETLEASLCIFSRYFSCGLHKRFFDRSRRSLRNDQFTDTRCKESLLQDHQISVGGSIYLNSGSFTLDTSEMKGNIGVVALRKF